MELHLVFHKLLDEQKQELDSASYNANPDYVPPAAAASGSRSGASMSGNAAGGDVVDSCMENFDGTVSPYGSNGCVDRATVAAAGYSPFAAQEYNSNVKDATSSGPMPKPRDWRFPTTRHSWRKATSSCTTATASRIRTGMSWSMTATADAGATALMCTAVSIITKGASTWGATIIRRPSSRRQGGDGKCRKIHISAC